MGFVSSLGRDLTLAIRQMRQTPIVSGIALLSLALGIGANVAIFSLVNALMLKQLPVHAPEQLVIFGYDLRRQPAGRARRIPDHLATRPNQRRRQPLHCGGSA